MYAAFNLDAQTGAVSISGQASSQSENRLGNKKKWGRVERDEPRQRNLSKFARSSALAPFRISNYRFQWPADLLTSWAFEMETLILGWYVLVETGSVLLLTLLASLNYTGTLIAPMFGVAGDRIGHRDLLGVRGTPMEKCDLRIGIATGEALVGSIGSELLTP